MTRAAADQPLLAVIILSVGAPAELGHAVRSIREQSTPSEIVIVNSGGGDVTARLPEDSDGITIVSSEDLLWPGAARNRGIAASRAPFIAFLASDCIARPGWVEGRVRLHLMGNAAVASAIVNPHPASAVSTAYHIVHTATRDPRVQPKRATRYGASYARWLFDRYGPFREDLRVAEDSDFLELLPREHQPVWAPEIQTIHANPVRLWPALLQHYQRGRHAGTHWAAPSSSRFFARTRQAIATRTSDFDLLVDPPRPASRTVMHFLIGAMVLAQQLGKSRGRRLANAQVRMEALARASMKARALRRSAGRWGKAAVIATDPRGPLLHQANTLVKAGKHSDAAAIYRRLIELAPDACCAHLGLASTYAESKSFDDARRLLAEAAMRFGRRFAIVLAMAKMETVAGNLARASEHYQELADAYPQTPDGRMGLAEIALSRQDWDSAVHHLRLLGTRYRQYEALYQAAEILHYTGRHKEVSGIVEALEILDDGPDTLPLETLIRVLNLGRNTDALVSRIERNRRRLADAPRPAARVAFALLSAGRPQEALEITEQVDARWIDRFSRVRISANLALGRTDEALHIAAGGQAVEDLPPSAFLPLVSAAYERDGVTSATALVTSAAARQNKLSLRVAALFEAARLRSLAGLSQAEPHMPEASCEQDVIELCARAGQRSAAHEELRLIKTHAELFAGLRGKNEAFAPDPRFVARDAVTVAAAIASAIREERGFALIRLGDGEGNALPYRPQWSLFKQTDLAATERAWWGSSDPDTASLEGELHAAIDAADVVGIPDLFRLGYVSSLQAALAPNARSRNVRGLLAALDYGVGIKGALLTSCHIHQALGHWGLWDILLPQLGTVSLITCHEGLGAALSRMFSVSVDETHLIPPEFKHAAKFSGPVVPGRHYPDTFNALREPLSQVKKGQVVLVAAGVLGKIYCAWIKQAGGIAIDVGSAADIWNGYDTRPLHENFAYRTPPGVREGFERLASSDPLVASVVRLRG